ncbi:COG4223 family protein [Palleronia sp. LCG004]|uniref:COG4223 family protein n=1 Tax=Palleronia sp. LCG004 TaxID=3079304 RepID=UPI0029421DE6|nr:mitofilin family membrane protein [Palleronia sp. LCG004]WOI55910.1 mitofilin family membrane protein [Palleronia sp. LCG004]
MAKNRKSDTTNGAKADEPTAAKTDETANVPESSTTGDTTREPVATAETPSEDSEAHESSATAEAPSENGDGREGTAGGRRGHDRATTDQTASTDPATSAAPIVQPDSGSATQAGAASSRGPSVAMLLLGGFLAAAIGYLAAYYGEFGLFGANPSEDEEAMAQIVASHESRIDQIETALGAPDESNARLDASDAGLAELRENLGSLVGNLDSLDERIGGVEAGLAGNASTFDPEQLGQLGQTTDDLRNQLDELSQRISAIESGSQDQVASLEQRVDELSQQVDGAANAAQEEARRIASQAALSEIRAAIDAGSPYQDAVGAYREASDADLPNAITAPAPDGVVTLAELQDRFDPAAREALDASLRATVGDGPIDRFGAFLRAQTGARSLDEREGAGPDAVLSRAQARVGEGDLEAALSELQDLPQEGRDAMSDWIDSARARLDAEQAAADLPTSQNSN